MKIPLSDRLLACCGFVKPGDRVADVGCDHGYLGIYLLKNGIAKQVFASDINEGPLQAAVRNSEKFGVRDKISFYLSDGVRNLPRDFDTLVCAGMGADTIVSILSAAPWLKNEQYRLILQCQSKTPTLRRYLSENGWQITEESVLRDGRFLYTVMEVIRNPDAMPLTVGQWYISPALLSDTHPETVEYIFRIMEGLRLATSHTDDPEKVLALKELESIFPDEEKHL